MHPWAYPTQHPKRHLSRFGSAVFAQLTAERPYTLQLPVPFQLKIASSHCEIWTPINTWFIGPTQVHNPNGISIGSAVFAGLAILTDRQRQTDRPTENHATPSVTTGHIYVSRCGPRSNCVVAVTCECCTEPVVIRCVALKPLVLSSRSSTAAWNSDGGVLHL